MMSIIEDSAKLFIDKVLFNEKTLLFIQDLVRDKWNNTSKKGKKLVEELINDNDKFNKFMNSHIYETLFFKTIDGKHENIFIDEIFIESELIDSKKEKKTILDILELSKNNVLCIDGIAGHGKSTLLRKILYESIVLKFKIPLFIELRKINAGNSIIDEIIKIFNFSGLSPNKDVVESVLSSGRFLLLLDGFDEVSSIFEKKVYEEIEFLKLNIRTPMIITSRPDTAICNTSMVKNLSLKDLTGEKALAIIKKRMDDENYEKARGILENNHALLNSLITPILVSLFCACYPESDYIPLTASDYYDRIFNILYDGHDKRKLYYDREKKLKLSTDSALNVFTAFSFLCFINSKLSFDKSFAKDKINKSLEKQGIENDELDQSNYLDDLIRVTGLIKNDGYDNFTYIHRSILEYHAAKYILESDSKKIAYQNKILDKLINLDNRYIAITEFLFDKDEESTIKNIGIPLFEFLGFGRGSIHKEEIKKNLLRIVMKDARVASVFHRKLIKKKRSFGEDAGVFVTKSQDENEISNSINIFIRDKSQKIDSISENVQNILLNDRLANKFIRGAANVDYIEGDRVNIDLEALDIDLNDDNSHKTIDLINEFNLMTQVLHGLDETVEKLTKTYNGLYGKLSLMTSNDHDFDL
ncbi:NACHT domain-containing protein [Providencia sp. PROV202]|uniref:NACHT domain-containing protein n=1 Tax=Providencia sp. PROV202 TaxID=2949902 RepID=UPI00234B50A6|nr:NACHT domain-containing protein [Providencia sp. PROV202]